LAAKIKKELGIETELIKSKGGAFEVKVDGKLIFSKLELGRFPEHSEILSQLRA
jgi:selT/selW/selH-like putative selenoprotein